MFGKLNKSSETALEQTVAHHKKFGRKSYVLNMPYSVDLGAADNPYGLTWKTLPGQYSEDNFVARNRLLYMATVGSPLTKYFSWEQKYAGYSGTSYSFNGTTGTLSYNITGATIGNAGAWFGYNLTAANLQIVRKNSVESDHTYTLTNAQDPVNLFEYNGFLWFTAFKVDICSDILCYVPPSLTTTDYRSTKIQYMAIENMGSNGTVGLFKGQLVLATTLGVWEIRPGGSFGHYVLGSRIGEWNLSQDAEIAIGSDLIMALDGSDLITFGQGLNANTRWNSIACNGKDIVLGGTNEVAISNAGEFETYSGFTAYGACVVDGSNRLHTTERVTYNAGDTVFLETTVGHFPGQMSLQDVWADRSVQAIDVTTDFATYNLLRSSSNENLWRAGITGKTLQITFQVPTLTDICSPVLYIAPRSYA